MEYNFQWYLTDISMFAWAHYNWRDTGNGGFTKQI